MVKNGSETDKHNVNVIRNQGSLLFFANEAIILQARETARGYQTSRFNGGVYIA